MGVGHLFMVRRTGSALLTFDKTLSELAGTTCIELAAL
jgi:hypothetical protein